MPGESRKVTFVGSGGAELAARLDLPVGGPRAYALFAHCLTCGEESLAAARISRELTEFGLAVLRFDFAGLGGSGGDVGNANFGSNVEDLVCAADCLRDRFTAPAVLIGHSLGGAAALAVSHRMPEVRAVVTIGTPADPAHVGHLLGPARTEIEQFGHADVVISGRRFRIGGQFLDDIAAQPQRDRISRLDAALLVLHSPQDEVVGIENARTIFDTARHPKSFVCLDDADHLLTRCADAEYAATVLAAWASRYAPPSSDTEPEDEPAPEGTVVVTETSAGTFAQRVSAGRHDLTADEPPPVGTDTGPAPYDLLTAALGACTSMTVRMYADRKRWPLERVRVELRHRRVHAQDCANCESESGVLDRFERILEFDGDLDEDQLRRLQEIAERCPVHRTLRSEVVIDTSRRDTARGDTTRGVSEPR